MINQVSSTILLLSGKNGSPAFDPKTNDPDNTKLLLDGEVGLSTTGWLDQSGLHNDMVFPLNGSMITTPNGMKGVRHQAATNGQYGQTTTPALSVDDGLTIYFVYRTLYLGNKFVMSDTRGANWVLGMRHSGGAPLKSFQIGSSGLSVPTQATDWTWHVMSLVLKKGTNTCSWRINKDTPTLTLGMNESSKIQHGLVISADYNGAAFTSSSCEWAYIIMRSSVDSLEVQDQYADYFNSIYEIW